jgi:3D (Asp-Asp-Asp) domain-containing protein
VILDILTKDVAPSSNGSEAIQIVLGLGQGAEEGIELLCFKDAKVVIPDLIGGVLDLLTGVRAPQGVKDIFDGLVGVVPAFHDCMADKPQIVTLLHMLGDLKDPKGLAEVVGHNIVSNKLDLSLETAQAVLDYRSKEWARFGQDIGMILDKILIHGPSNSQVLKASELAWPWPSHKTESNVSLFKDGVAEALGFKDVGTCLKDVNVSIPDLEAAAHLYRHGGYLGKAKALVKLSQGMEKLTVGLGACTSFLGHVETYNKLINSLKDSRFYSMHNALSTCLNVAEDHGQLGAVAAAMEKGDFKTSGFELTNVILDVLNKAASIPSKNGSVATQIALGLGEGTVHGVEVKCFEQASVEIPDVVGGVLDLMTGVMAVKGVESIFHGLVGLVPALKQCMADKPRIVALLHELHDLKDPVALAKIVGNNILTNKLDLSLETASAVLDYKAELWLRFGQDLGKILAKIMVAAPSKDDFIVI